MSDNPTAKSVDDRGREIDELCEALIEKIEQAPPGLLFRISIERDVENVENFGALESRPTGFETITIKRFSRKLLDLR